MNVLQSALLPERWPLYSFRMQRPNMVHQTIRWDLSQGLHFAFPATAVSKYSQHSDSLLRLAIVIENTTAMILQACFIEILWRKVGRHSHFAQVTTYNCRRQCGGICVISGQLGFVCFVWKMQSCLCFTFDISSPTFLLSPRVSAFTTEVVFKYCFTKRSLNVYSACRGRFCDCMKLNDRQCRLKKFLNFCCQRLMRTGFAVVAYILYVMCDVNCCFVKPCFNCWFVTWLSWLNVHTIHGTIGIHLLKLWFLTSYESRM